MLISPAAEVAWTRMRARIAGTADECLLTLTEVMMMPSVGKNIIDIVTIAIAVIFTYEFVRK